MKGLCLGSLGLALGLLGGSARAEDIEWRALAPAPTATAPVATNVNARSAGWIGQPPGSPTVGSAAVRQVSCTDPAQLNLTPPLPVDVSQPLPMAPEPQPEPIPPPSGMKSSPTAGDKAGGAPPGIDGTIVSNPVCCGDAGCGPPCCGSSRGGLGLGLGWWRKAPVDGCCTDSCCSDTSGTDGCCTLWGNCSPKKATTFYFGAEYLLWTVKSMGLPPLVTINTAGNMPVLGVPGTVTAYGGDDVDTNLRSGGRFTLGFDVPFLPNTTLETTYFFLGTRTSSASFASDGSTTIGRPFTSTGTSSTGFAGNQDAEIVAIRVPGLNVPGVVNISTSNELWGAEANLRHNLCSGCCWNIDAIYGFRYINLTESVGIGESIGPITGTAAMGLVAPPFGSGATGIQVLDNFRTRNDYYAGQIGLDGEYRLKRWFFDVTGKLGLGDMHEVAVVNGVTVFNNSPTVQSGGLLTQPSNIGVHSRDTFAVAPELCLKVGYNITDHLRGYVGYDVLYLSSVVRPGDIIDTNVNPNQIAPRSGPVAGPALPGFQFRTTDFWAQGVCFGLEWHY